MEFGDRLVKGCTVGRNTGVGVADESMRLVMQMRRIDYFSSLESRKIAWDSMAVEDREQQMLLASAAWIRLSG